MNENKRQRFIRLKANIEKDLQNLEKLKREKDNLDVEQAHPRLLGSIIHDFYTGIERIFCRLAEDLEGGLPKGENWHSTLLDDMNLELSNVRPAVISVKLKDRLKEYLGFRHLFRNVYGFKLKKERLKVLIDNFDEVFSDFKNCMESFLGFITEIAQG